ncbi:MAG: hypothetical protein J7497_11625, partial [Chitinophagaceae bacterium]|nr:hypothetical protein [Chitinophagaceae bacterium]
MSYPLKMNKKKPFLYSVIFLTLALPLQLFSQSSSNPVAFDIEAGTTLLTSRQVKDIYGPGLN